MLNLFGPYTWYQSFCLKSGPKGQNSQLQLQLRLTCKPNTLNFKTNIKIENKNKYINAIRIENVKTKGIYQSKTSN
jgi:hypothetical protein